MKQILVLTSILACSAPAFAYGPVGHTLVGDLGYARLDAATAAKVKTLIEGIPLGLAARLPDDIKNWDAGSRPYPEDQEDLAKVPEPLLSQLHAFHDANDQATAENPTELLHHQFHYTDVPIKDVEKYADGPTGRSKTDVVQMIKFCARVLHGDIPETNQYKITKGVAVILIAHYTGDIHQPLHVGAEYFNAAGEKTNPDTDHATDDHGDAGGNSISIGHIAGVTGNRYPPKLHSIWDGLMVTEAQKLIREETGKSAMTETDYVKYYLANPPQNWAEPADVPFTAWSEAWADQIQPIAREAHERLKFSNLKPVESRGATTEHGTASELPGGEYLKWGGGVTKNELGMGGYRLAAILEAALN